MNDPLPVSVAVLTLNEEQDLPRCLESVRGLASEIVVIDSGSTDRTRAIAESFGAIFEVHPWQGCAAQRNVALSRCSRPWALCLDADEAVSPELAAAIRALFANGEPREQGFLVNRLNFYLGQWIRHAWYPEWRLRLVRRDHARCTGVDPHDKIEVGGSTSRLAGDLFHHPFDPLQDHFSKTIKYARTMADSLVREGRTFHWYQAVFSPWLAFCKVLFLKSAWRDGWRGWVIAGSRGVGTFAKYAFMLERSRGWQKEQAVSK